MYKCEILAVFGAQKMYLSDDLTDTIECKLTVTFCTEGMGVAHEGEGKRAGQQKRPLRAASGQKERPPKEPCGYLRALGQAYL